MSAVTPADVARWEAEIRRAIRRTEDARAFTAEIGRIARAYPPEAAETPRSVRERYFSAAQRVAWAARFKPDTLHWPGLLAECGVELKEG